MSETAKIWIEDEKIRFINPYNFVSLGPDVERQEPFDGPLTGKISCKLLVRTPLAIPDAETKRTLQSHPITKFFRVGDQPVIPGSQLKGMVRSYFEAASNSCLSINNDNALTARHSFPRLPGLLQYDKGKKTWHLYEARKTPYTQQRAMNPANEAYRAWYVLSLNKAGRREVVLKKSIFTKIDNEVKCDNLKDAVTDYDKNISIYKQGINFKNFSKGENAITYHVEKDGKLYPVFYEIVKNNQHTYVYLSPSQMGRSVFVNKIDALLGTHHSCSKHTPEKEENKTGKGETKKQELCKACMLFGMIAGKGGKNRASRVRFSDAKAVQFDSDKKVSLKILSNPKTTSVEFYSHRPEDALVWTYDSKTTGYKPPKAPGEPSEPVRTLCKVELNGRKFYVHHPKLEPSDYMSSEATKLNSSVELCKPDSEFEFDIFFENITREQLHELVWTLALGDNSAESDQMFKLGHGKPLGLGSVKVLVDQIEIREFDREARRYTVTKEAPDEMIANNPFDAGTDSFQEFMAITNFRTLEPYLNENVKISYPLADNGDNRNNSKASHQWFIANRSIGKSGNSTAWSIKYMLPGITAEDPSLPKMFIDKGKKKP